MRAKLTTLADEMGLETSLIRGIIIDGLKSGKLKGNYIKDRDEYISEHMVRRFIRDKFEK